MIFVLLGAAFTVTIMAKAWLNKQSFTFLISSIIPVLHHVLLHFSLPPPQHCVEMYVFSSILWNSDAHHCNITMQLSQEMSARKTFFFHLKSLIASQLQPFFYFHMYAPAMDVETVSVLESEVLERNYLTTWGERPVVGNAKADLYQHAASGHSRR